MTRPGVHKPTGQAAEAPLKRRMGGEIPTRSEKAEAVRVIDHKWRYNQTSVVDGGAFLRTRTMGVPPGALDTSYAMGMVAK